MSKRPMLFGCAECPNLGKIFKLDKSPDSLNTHYRDSHWGIASYVCSVCQVHFDHKTSMVRHMTASHESSDDETVSDAVAGPSGAGSHEEHYNVGNNSEEMEFASPSGSPERSEVIIIRDSNQPQSVDMAEIAGEVVMELRSTARLTNAAVNRFQDGYKKLLEAHTQNVLVKLSAALKAKGMPEDEISEVLNEVHISEDPFEELKTIEKQLKYYEKKYGLVIPKECFLDSRIDNRLNPKTNEYIPTQVTESFQYVPAIETMKLILSNKKMRDDIFKDLASKDGVLRSYVDGSDFKNHPYLKKHKNVLHICLFYDELEIASALGSKTIIHKLGVFFFQIVNGSARLKSKLSSIHLLALAYADDFKKKGAFEKVLFQFVEEMKKLGSDEGVQITVDGAPFDLRAILVAVSADTLAAHELLGFLAPGGARHFCRICMISRILFRANGNEEAPLRTRDDHDTQVLEVQRNYRLSTVYGVKQESCLNKCPYFHCVDGSVFDAFHDILEGVVPEVVKHVLRNLICKRKLFTIHNFNNRLNSFSYGVPDSKNKPSANFVMEMLTTTKPLKQTGAQLWCLMRVLPFLVAADVPEGDEYLEVIFIVQDIMKIVFSFEVSQDDLAMLDSLVFKLLEDYKTLFVDPAAIEAAQANQNEEEEAEAEAEAEGEGEGEEEEEEDEDVFLENVNRREENDNQNQPGQRKKKKKKKKILKVHLFNKLHHLKHYVDLIKRFGPIVRFWCAKFEASLKIFRQYAAICCNFRNPPKTMAQMFQLSHLWSIVSAAEEGDSMLEFGSTTEMSLENVEHSNILEEAGIIQFSITNKAIIFGEEYRPGLFLAFKKPEARTPEFAVITDIYIVGESAAYFVLKPWKGRLSGQYNAYLISPDETSTPFLKNALSLENFRPIAPWNIASGDIFLAPRTQVL